MPTPSAEALLPESRNGFRVVLAREWARGMVLGRDFNRAARRRSGRRIGSVNGRFDPWTWQARRGSTGQVQLRGNAFGHHRVVEADLRRRRLHHHARGPSNLRAPNCLHQRSVTLVPSGISEPRLLGCSSRRSRTQSSSSLWRVRRPAPTCSYLQSRSGVAFVLASLIIFLVYVTATMRLLQVRWVVTAVADETRRAQGARGTGWPCPAVGHGPLWSGLRSGLTLRLGEGFSGLSPAHRGMDSGLVRQGVGRCSGTGGE